MMRAHPLEKDTIEKDTIEKGNMKFHPLITRVGRAFAYGLTAVAVVLIVALIAVLAANRS
jgi:hypothetical protein